MRHHRAPPSQDAPQAGANAKRSRRLEAAWRQEQGRRGMKSARAQETLEMHDLVDYQASERSVTWEEIDLVQGLSR